ncbi:MAG: hypothetical protein Q9165_002777 [Trypethelium subeluteriae]
MAWFSGGSSNEALVENLAHNGLINSDRVKNAMLAVRPPRPPVLPDSQEVQLPGPRSTPLHPPVDRAHYSPYAPYADSPQSIGHSATISAPHMHASASETLLPFLKPSPSTRVLDIGSGSGYLTAVLAHIVNLTTATQQQQQDSTSPTGSGGGGGGTVIGLDHIQELVDMAKTNMAKSEDGRGMLESGKVRFVKGDGRKGWREGAPYDAIHVGAAAAKLHEELVDQLKAPGRLFVPVEELYQQHIYVIDKKEDGSVTREKVMAVRYVPLTDAPAE